MSRQPDLEAEYNNRARVPEHPAIIAGWAREAAGYRAALGERFEAIPYGRTERQVIDLFRPEADAGSAVVVFIHGGYWQALDRSSFSHLARGLNARGVTVALPGYDLCPQVSVGEIIDQVRQACRVLLGRASRLVVAGHSAGGHLAACMLATSWRSLDPDLPPNPVAAGYALSGLFDLTPLLATSVNQALGLSAAEAERLSPLAWDPPVGLTFDAVVGGSESAEYLRQSQAIAARWAEAGVSARAESLPGLNHFTVIEPLADPESAMTRRIADLARQAASGSPAARPVA